MINKVVNLMKNLSYTIKEIERFENNAADYVGSKYGSVSSCSAGMHLACKV